ncbi:MAG: hypothetical protein M3Y87_19460 [Myxococcota bacterium]|nr:hypothetical protein [Myxococcota bacterium]
MSSRRNVWLVAVALTIATLASAPAARADHQIDRPFTGSRPFQLDFHGGLAWYGFGFAAGARFGIPIVQNGFIPTLDNAVYLNFGADIYFVDDDCRGFGGCDRAYRLAMGFPVALHWEFYFNDTWSVFAELGVNVYLPPGFFHRGVYNFREDAGAWVIAAVGGTLHLGDVFALTLRVGNPYVAFGITLNLG